MKYSIDAIFENGSFRPLSDPPNIAEGARVRLVVEQKQEPDILRLATSVYQGLSDRDIADIEQIALRRDNFFGPGTESQ